ncbi:MULTISPECIES: DUF2905 family protein [Caldimonas]|jgi:hypothetical protein|uniref:DUF2905 family protein n=1 Tax=Caldimonas TaxID=196013 RepID=UPI00036343B1|nr:DUF2905 family protein [Caldimonas manganoxidans]
MLRWLLIILLALIVFNGLSAWLHRIGLGRLPGDFHFKLGGRQWDLPLTSAVLLSLLAALIGKFV